MVAEYLSMYTRVKKKKKDLAFFTCKKNKKNNNNGNKVKTKNLHALFVGNERRDASKTAMKTQRNTGVNNKIKIKQIEREGGVSFFFFFWNLLCKHAWSLKKSWLLGKPLHSSSLGLHKKK